MNVYESARSPVELARHLAKYISDPSTIQARVKDHFGKAPSKGRCAEIISKVRTLPRTHYAMKAKSYYYHRFTCDHERTEANAFLSASGEVYCRICRDAS